MAALSFRDAKTQTKIGYLCMLEGCRGSKRGMRSGRYRVAIAGYPLRARDGTELRICSGCKDNLERMWSEALGPVREKVAA